jgi:hypothetical protein
MEWCAVSLCEHGFVCLFSRYYEGYRVAGVISRAGACFFQRKTVVGDCMKVRGIASGKIERQTYSSCHQLSFRGMANLWERKSDEPLVHLPSIGHS